MEESNSKAKWLVNRSQVRRFLLEYAQRSRRHRFSRVAPTVHDQLEAKVRDWCRQIIHAQPSAGRTIK